MSKTTHFFGTSVFGQLISYIDDHFVRQASKTMNSDHYIKKFTTKDHLISMVFCAFAKCSSLREVSGAMLGLAGKTSHFQLKHIPKRSTLSDANNRRNAEVFGLIYNLLLRKYHHVISDSRIKDVVHKQIEIIDSTTISLFKDILACVGRNPKSGRRKGGIKVHTLINVDEVVPKIVWFSDATTHDHEFLKKLKYSDNKIYVFDKAYNDYQAFEKMTACGTGFVTRMKDNALYGTIEANEIGEEIHSGVIKDEEVMVRVDSTDCEFKLLRLRRIEFYDRVEKKHFVFTTNLFDMRADLVAALYKLRWQIELLFKQLKQNFPLKYFLGDNENAIKIQIYCALIANLLMTVIQKKLKRSWSFSNLVSFTKIHLFNYINLLAFLEDPEKDWQKNIPDRKQLTLFEGAYF